MFTIRRQKPFLKDLSKVKMSNQHYSKYILYLSMLIQGEQFPSEALDHSLMGEYKDTREFHIAGDLLVIYLLTEIDGCLFRIGTHAQLFK